MAFKKEKIKSGKFENLNWEIFIFKAKKGDFYSVEIWDREFEWQGKLCRSRQLDFYNLDDLPKLVEFLNFEIGELKERRRNGLPFEDMPAKFKKEIKIDIKEMPKVDFEDEDIPF